MDAPLLRLDDVSFSFGKSGSVEHLTLDVGPGEVVGLVGAERSGKSTVVRLVAGLLKPEDGSVSLFGEDLADAGPEGLRRVGVALNPPAFFESWTGRRNLQYAADLRGLRDEQRVRWAISRLGLGGRADDPVRTYSRSFRQALALARALVGGPSLLVLDEPTRELDPERARTFRGLVVRLAREAKVGALLATSSLEEAVACAEKVAILDGGRVIHQGPGLQIKLVATQAVLTMEDAERAAEELVRIRGVSSELISSETIGFGGSVDVAEVVSWLVGRGHRVEGLSRRGMTLEEFVLRLAQGPLPEVPETAPRPDEVEDVLELLDDGDTDLSAFLERPGGGDS